MEHWRVLADILADLATSIAVIVAGVWTYLLFIKNRERYPRATLENAASTLKLDEQSTLVRVQIRVTNSGKVLLPVEDLECRLLQVLPLVGSVQSKCEAGRTLLEDGEHCIGWPMLFERRWSYGKGQSEIEPGESETFCCDFVIDPSVRVVRIYSHLANPSKAAAIGWACTNDQNVVEGVASAQAPTT